ncbi:hypothetical protein BT93_L5166 [Corymbia citriodora subsp. variegata]|uniref:Uncharacterized protein n=1 Tax=Corymbia citriodora subsp. variegata TaxID=360336 RepID=A0A8T0CU16_CORYI|nr:hypothetical protein BT93_L5166 [Corymbia citriodora subsp. variegata]
MDAREFETIKAEKARCPRRYPRNQRLKDFLRASEICVALLLLAYYYSGISLSAAGVTDSLGRAVSLFAKPLSVFLLSNAIIITVIVLSGKDAKRGPARDVYDEYVAHQRNFARNSTATETSPEETVVDKQIVLYSSPTVRENPAPTVTDPEAHRDEATVEATETDRAVEKLPAIPSAKQCRRTQTTATTRVQRVQRELRLSSSGSDRGRHDRAVRLRRPCAVDELSDEEFNRRVEKYIERTRTFLRKEKMADAMKESCKAIGYQSVWMSSSRDTQTVA